jgi:uncharacterized protein YhaN
MKITDLEIDGFGVWHDLKLRNLSPRVTAFYGENEAGKTTVMQFARAMLYGVSPDRRRRYLPPLAGGRPGGKLGITENDTPFSVTRYADRGDDDTGRVICTLPDGSTVGDRLLRDAVGDVDETTFTNIFAVGLSEIQELGTLSGTKAAEWLYRLTSGLDRVSLYDVITQLRDHRNSLLSDQGTTSRITELTAKRDLLRSDIDRLRGQNRQWSQLAVKRAELEEQIVLSEREVRHCEHHARTIEIAVGLKTNWRKREKISEQLALLTGRIRLPDDAIDRLDALNASIEKHQRQADILQGQRHQLRDESQRLGINEVLVRHSCRIDALGEQRVWLESLLRQRHDLEKEARQFENRRDSEQRRLADTLGLKNEQQLREITEDDLEQLRPQIDAVRSAENRLEQAFREVEALTESERTLKTQIETAIVGGEQHGLPMDLQEASDLVAKLRKRLQVEQRLEQARQHELEMEQQGHELLDDQVMPLWLFGWTLAAVVLGALMVGVSMLVPNSPLAKYGGLVAIAGIGMSAFSFVFKYFTEDAAADKLDACHRQLDTLGRQIKETEIEKEKIDSQLPMTDGSVVLRLQAAERHLAELENVLPVQAQRKQAGSQVASAESRLQQAERQRDEAVKQWQAAASALGLPGSIEPQRLLSVTERLSLLGELETRARHRREDADTRQREYDALVRRIEEICEEVASASPNEEATPLEKLEHLLSERRQQLTAIARRDELRDRATQLKAQEGKHRRAIVGIQRRRTAIFQSADCQDEQAYRMLVADQHQANLLADQQRAVTREIAAAIGKHEPEEVFAQLLSPESIGQLEAMWEQATAALETAQSQLTHLAQQSGAITQSQQALAEDRSLAEAQLDLGQVEQQLARARNDWREYAVVSRVLESIRADYEAHRQPETLAEASKYMSQLTAGRYVRVWTPLANDVLLVENGQGESLPIDVLSRGTREQLFLSVRLALVAMYARRGINLPMVLDDVLVNCDAVRAQRAAKVLCDFAAGGRQILVFTCHEHMWQMFRALSADCRRLPRRHGIPEDATDAPEAALESEPAAPLPPPPEIEAETLVEAPAPRPRKLRKPKKKVASKPREPEPAAAEPAPAPSPQRLYDYPFVERLVEEIEEIEPAPVEIDLPDPADKGQGHRSRGEVYEYSFDPQRREEAADFEFAESPDADGEAVAYILDASPPEPRSSYHDHLESRRA